MPMWGWSGLASWLTQARGRRLSRVPTPAATALKTVSTHGSHEFSLDGSRYLASANPEHTLNLHSVQSSGSEPELVCVFRLPEGPKPRVTVEWMKHAIETYERDDDVFQKAFLATVIFSGAREEEVDLPQKAHAYLTTMGNQRIVFLPYSSTTVLPGPYLLMGNELRDVWKIVDDSYGTCMETLKPQSSSAQSFEPFQCTSANSQFPSFALRSQLRRLGSAPNLLPLDGLRIVVKDNIHLKGVRVSQGNRAFYDTYPPQLESAECIQKLLDKGVSVVGKAKMNAFANWEEPLEYVDYQAPWNPRADRYQSPGGSSSGSAAAMAAYPWLDAAIGTDTWGSVTRPAAWCGLFGLRPSKGTVSTKGIEPFCGAWDTAGLLTRDLQKCRDIAAEWLVPDALIQNPGPISSIIWSKDYWSIVDPKQVTLAQDFVKTLKAALNIESHDVSFWEFWEQNPPKEANNLSLQEYIVEASKAQCYDAYHSTDDFRASYQRQFGHAPYVTPPTQGMWDFAKTITKEKRDEGFKKLDIYKTWFNETILNSENSNALVIMPLESMVPRYRDEAPKMKRPPQPGVNALALAAVLGAPALAVPIAEIPYHSRVTQREEKLPFVVAIMGKPGTDLALMETVQTALEKAGLPTKMQSGRSMLGYGTAELLQKD